MGTLPVDGRRVHLKEISAADNWLYMSLTELLLIFVVAFLVIKPEDVPKIAKKIREFNKLFVKLRHELASYLEPDLKKNDFSHDEEVKQINFYLEKIASTGNGYEGEYSLDKIRNHYQKLIKKSIQLELKERGEVPALKAAAPRPKRKIRTSLKLDARVRAAKSGS